MIVANPEPLHGMPPEAAMGVLIACGAGSARHSGRTLLHHLLGTYRLLQEWGNAPHVCLGGLFHSIYSTNDFKRRSLGVADRAQLREAIGSDAEGLAWAFCGLDRPRVILEAFRGGIPSEAVAMTNRLEDANREPLLVMPSQLTELAEIECANLIEQQSKTAALRDLYCTAVSRPGVWSSPALTAARLFLSRRLAAPVATEAAEVAR